MSYNCSTLNCNFNKKILIWYPTMPKFCLQRTNMNKMQSLLLNNVNSTVVKKSICKYVTRQMWEMSLEKLKQNSPWLCWNFKDFHTRFIPFYNRIKIIYLLQSQGVRLTFLNVNDVRIPLLFKVKSPTSRVIIPLL